MIWIIKLAYIIDDKQLRNINDCKIDLSTLIENIKDAKDNIVKVNYKIDNNVSFKDDKSVNDLLEEIEDLGIEVSEFEFWGSLRCLKSL